MWPATVAIVLSFGEDGHGPVPEARRLMVASAFAAVPFGIWQLRHRHEPSEQAPPHMLSGAAVLSGALALFGGGMDYDHPDGLWLLLLAPGAVSFAAIACWLMFDRRARAVPRRWRAALGCLMFAGAAVWLMASDLL